MRPTRVVVLLALMGLGLAACGETEQVVVYKQGKYQGKADTKPWDNAPLTYGDAKWNKGDQASWENEVNTRTLSQNEYRRIYNQ